MKPILTEAEIEAIDKEAADIADDKADEITSKEHFDYEETKNEFRGEVWDKEYRNALAQLAAQKGYKRGYTKFVKQGNRNL